MVRVEVGAMSFEKTVLVKSVLSEERSRTAASGHKRLVNELEMPSSPVGWNHLFRLINPSCLDRPFSNDLDLDRLVTACAVKMNASFWMHHIRSGLHWHRIFAAT